MTMLSLRLSRAIMNGRRDARMPESRAQLLATLLRKRAAAHNAGSVELEEMLRSQIKWALPMEQDPVERG